jgi:uncharacterized membrane protein YkvA (DUF1232 family)
MILKKLEVLMLLKKLGGGTSIEKEIKMNKFMKLALLVAIGAYVISPADAIPGPVDDLIIMLLGLAANKKLNAKKAAECCDLSGKNFVEADGVEVRSA